MLPKYHQQYTKEVLKGFRLSKEKRKQIIIGSIVNDYCELTNDGNIFNIKDTSTLFFNRDMLRGNNAFFQSHFGYLTSLHFMSKKEGEPAEITRDELKMWFKFLNNVAAGRLTVPANSVISKDDGIISKMFAKDKIEYKMIFDTDKSEEIRYRSLGMMLHLIQDALTPSHCQRNEKNEIVQFYYYGAQDSSKHRKADDILAERKEFLFEQCRECIKNVLESRLYKTKPILSLSENAQVSSGGEYA
jgi:hypothetical protein